MAVLEEYYYRPSWDVAAVATTVGPATAPTDGDVLEYTPFCLYK